MASLYDQFHSNKNLDSIYDLINDLIKKNNGNDIINDVNFKNYYIEQSRKIFINSKSENLVDLNRELIKHHIIYYRDKYKNTDTKNKDINIKINEDMNKKMNKDIITAKINDINDITDDNDDVLLNFNNYLENRKSSEVVSVSSKIEKDTITKEEIKPEKFQENNISFDDMINNINSKDIISNVEKSNAEKSNVVNNNKDTKKFTILTSANRTNIMSNRFDYNVKCDTNITHLERLIIPIENKLHFTLPMLKIKIPEMNIDTNLYLNETYNLNNYTYGIYISNEDVILNKISDNLNIQICSIYDNGDTKIINDIIECEVIDDKLKPKNMDDFKLNDIISINSKHFTKIIDIIDDSLVLEKLPLELEESIYIMNMNLQNTLVFS